MATITTPYTFQLNDTGVVLNSDPAVGMPFVDITAVQGLDNAPYRVTQRDHEGVDGGFMDAEFETGRNISLDGTVYGNGQPLEDYLDSLKANFAPSTTAIPFYFVTDVGSLRLVNVKPLGCQFDWDIGRRLGITPITFKMYAEDPRIYSSQLTTSTLQIGSIVTNGFGFNLAFNLSFGGGSTNVGQYFSNSGNRPTPATFTINGPVTNPIIINDTIGSSLTFNIDVASGETLVIDLLNHTVKLNGVTNRRNTLLAPAWFLLGPGQTFLRFQATAGTGSLVVSMRSAWR